MPKKTGVAPKTEGTFGAVPLAPLAEDDPPWARDLDDPDNEGQQAEAPDDSIAETGSAQGVPASDLDEFHAETTSNPAPPPKKPRTTSGKRKPVEVKEQPLASIDGDGVEDFDTSEVRECESIDDIQFHSLDDTDDYLRVLLYGAEGTRKTTNACLMTRLTEPGRVLVVNAEGGLKKQALRKHGVDTSRIAVWPAPGQQVTYVGLERLFYRLSSGLSADPDSWLGVIWDSVTDIHQVLLDQIVAADIAKQRAILEKNKGRRPGNISLRDEFERDGDDYVRMSNQFRLLLRKYRYLPCHMVATALVRTDGEGRKAVIGPGVTPAIGKELRGYMDMVLHTQVAQISGAFVGFAETVPTINRRAKDRFDVLPAELPNPSFDRLMAYVTGELTVDNDPDVDLLGDAPDGPTDPAARAEVAAAQELSRTATKINDAAAERDNPVREAVRATAARVNARRATSKKPAAAGPVPSNTADDQPPY